MSSSLDQTTPAAEHSAQLALAALVSVVLVIVLAAVAFWPTRTWTPPARPGLSKPIVFDEFFNAPPSPNASPTGAASGAP